MFAFQYPQAFLALLGILLLLWLTWRQLQKREIVVASLELWQFIITKKSSTKRRFWSILQVALQILAYTLLVTALAMPFWVKKTPQIYRFVIDCSASMATLVSEKTVFSKAIDYLDRQLGTLPKNSQVHLLTLPDLQRFQANPDKIRRQLPKLFPLQVTLNKNVLKVLSKKEKYYFITDGCLLLDLPYVHSLYFGSSFTDNVGIVDLKIKINSQGSYTLIAIIENFSSILIAQHLVLKEGKKKLFAESIKILPQQKFIWKHTLASHVKKWTLRLMKKDNFAVDNVVFACKTPPVKIWIEPHLRSTLQFDYLQEVQKSSKKLAEVWFTAHTHLVFPEKKLVLLNGATPPGMRSHMERTGEIVASKTPLLKAVYPQLIDIPYSYPLPFSLKKDTEGLLYTSKGVIMAQNTNWLYIGFDIATSNWQDLPSFPVFWKNFFQINFANRGHFDYQRTSLDMPKTGFWQRDFPQAINLLSSHESNNIGKYKIPKKLFSNRYGKTNQTPLHMYFLAFAIAAVIALWWVEKK